MRANDLAVILAADLLFLLPWCLKLQKGSWPASSSVRVPPWQLGAFSRSLSSRGVRCRRARYRVGVRSLPSRFPETISLRATLAPPASPAWSRVRLRGARRSPTPTCDGSRPRALHEAARRSNKQPTDARAGLLAPLAGASDWSAGPSSRAPRAAPSEKSAPRGGPHKPHGATRGRLRAKGAVGRPGDSRGNSVGALSADV
eukprot:scaffold634_cov401-Prasinococcus_capsulatus_cf.AAC.11